MTLSQQVLNEIRKEFRRQEVVFAFLFGSRATGRTSSRSDYDFAVFLGTDDSRKQFSIKKKLAARLPTIIMSAVDVIILDKAALGIAFRAIQEGIIIYDTNPETREEYVERLLQLYPDYQIFQQRFLEDYRRGVTS